MVHIGKQIKKTVKEKGMGVTEFARRINTNRNNVYDIFQRESLDTALLKKISNVLQLDFFKYFSDYPTDLSDIESGKNKTAIANEENTNHILSKEISSLLKKIEHLQSENKLLKSWIKDKDKIIEMLQKKK